MPWICPCCTRVTLEHLLHRFMHAATSRTDRDRGSSGSGRPRPRKTVAGAEASYSAGRRRSRVTDRRARSTNVTLERAVWQLSNGMPKQPSRARLRRGYSARDLGRRQLDHSSHVVRSASCTERRQRPRCCRLHSPFRCQTRQSLRGQSPSWRSYMCIGLLVGCLVCLSACQQDYSKVLD